MSPKCTSKSVIPLKKCSIFEQVRVWKVDQMIPLVQVQTNFAQVSQQLGVSTKFPNLLF